MAAVIDAVTSIAPALIDTAAAVVTAAGTTTPEATALAWMPGWMVSTPRCTTLFFLDYFQVLLQRKRASERVGRAGRGRNEKREMNTGRVHARERHRPIQRDVVLFVSKFALSCFSVTLKKWYSLAHCIQTGPNKLSMLPLPLLYPHLIPFCPAELRVRTP